MDLPDRSFDIGRQGLEASPDHSMRLERQSGPTPISSAHGQGQSPAQRDYRPATIEAMSPASPGTHQLQEASDRAAQFTSQETYKIMSGN